MGAATWGRSAHPFSWLLSSPQQPLETEDPPTVSLAPQYTSQQLCRARVNFTNVKSLKNREGRAQKSRVIRDTVQVFHGQECKNFT
jgi:hypothetical protein